MSGNLIQSLDIRAAGPNGNNFAFQLDKRTNRPIASRDMFVPVRQWKIRGLYVGNCSFSTIRTVSLLPLRVSLTVFLICSTTVVETCTVNGSTNFETVLLACNAYCFLKLFVQYHLLKRPEFK